MITRRIFAIAVLTLLAACSQPAGKVYPVPLAEVRRVLMATGLPPFVFGSETPDWDVRGGASDVTWTIRKNDVELFHYIAHLKEEDQANTRVEVELVGVDAGPAGNSAKGLAEHPAIRDMYIVAIKERIASALERRPFEMAQIYPFLGVATLENMGALRASADAAAAASARADRENIEKAHRDEAAGH